MAWKEYDYSTRYHRVSKQMLYRPLLDIEVSAENGSEIFSALIDSGSEVTIMSSEIAELIGVTSTGKRRGTVAGFGEETGFISPVRIVVPEFPSAILNTNVVFVDGVSSKFPFDILLGQDDFFRMFLIKFEKHKNKFYLNVV